MTNRGDNKSTVQKLEIGNTVIVLLILGKTWSKKFPVDSTTDFLTGNYCKSLFFTPTTAEEIIDIVNNLKNSNTTGVDGISVKLIKACNSILSPIRST